MKTTDPCSTQRRRRPLPWRAILFTVTAAYAAASCGLVDDSDDGDDPAGDVARDGQPSRPVTIPGREDALGAGGSAMVGAGVGAGAGGGAGAAGAGGGGLGEDNDVVDRDPAAAPPRGGGGGNNNIV